MIYQTALLANSSWHWVTVSPMKILPIAIILTLFIESYILIRYCSIKSISYVFFIVALANLTSFIIPYIERAFRFRAVCGDFISSFFGAFNKGPYYMVLSSYLILTLLGELPIIYMLLKGKVRNRKMLFISITVSNILTTGVVAVLERLICIGRW